MNDRLGALSWSFPMGRLFLTQIRVSPMFLLIGLILVARLGWEIGLAFTVILFLSTLAHELGHVLMARHTGGMADEILIWPLGGLAFAQPGPSLSAAIKTILAGPLVNLLLAILFFPGFYAPEMLWGVLNPVQMPIAEISPDHWGRDLLLLAFMANWLALLANLLPIYPLDGGQVVATVLQQKFPGEVAIRAMSNIGMIASFLLMSAGLILDLSWIVAFASLVLVMNVLMTVRLQMSDGYDDSFMGYDFSQGYTSLERGYGSSVRDPKPSWIKAWKLRRQSQREHREATRRQDLERQLDELLAKVHEHGMDALSDAEKRQLRRASEELRHRSKPQDS